MPLLRQMLYKCTVFHAIMYLKTHMNSSRTVQFPLNILKVPVSSNQLSTPVVFLTEWRYVRHYRCNFDKTWRDDELVLCRAATKTHWLACRSTIIKVQPCKQWKVIAIIILVWLWWGVMHSFSIDLNYALYHLIFVFLSLSGTASESVCFLSFNTNSDTFAHSTIFISFISAVVKLLHCFKTFFLTRLRLHFSSKCAFSILMLCRILSFRHPCRLPCISQ